MKKRVVVLIVVMVGLSLLGSFVIGDTAIGTIGLTILDPFLRINIISPENTTYNFEFDPLCVYPMDLNVTTNAELGPDGLLWYKHTDLKHDVILQDNVGFPFNITFDAVRFSNKVEVYAADTAGRNANENVTFFINISNHAPNLIIADEMLFCEGTYGSGAFSAEDVDEDSLSFEIDPSGELFFILDPLTLQITSCLTRADNEVITNLLKKGDLGGAKGWKTYFRNISVSDGSPDLSDWKQVNFTIIEINNAPQILNVLGAVTKVWTLGDDMNFTWQYLIDDIESGNQSSGNLTFNLTFLDGSNLFDINQSGYMNYTANETDIGVYDIDVCVIDQALEVMHPEIDNLCGAGMGLNKTTCDSFQLTVTNENRPPTITAFFPNELNFSALGTDAIYFNITDRDPDGTTPDTEWYVDGVSKEFDELSEFDNFTYTFGCGVSGLHRVKVRSTDGELNDTLQWNVTVGNVACPVEGGGGGGGGGGGKPKCEPLWGCGGWNVCQNVDRSLESGIISGGDYRAVKDQCSEKYWKDELCGFQIRGCGDINKCNVTADKPDELQACHFSLNPSCSDSIKNCHDGGCEFLIDCGGPCGACATCSDELQNQGEEGIDCGGPCPNRCPVEVPASSKFTLYIALVVIIIILFIIFGIRLYRIIKLRKETIRN